MTKHFTYLFYKKSIFTLTVFFLFSSLSIFSQYDTTHYIPYFADLTKRTKVTNLEFETTSGGAYFMFSTFEPGPVNIKVYKRDETGTNWHQDEIYEKDISPGQPWTWHIERGKTKEFFRYAINGDNEDLYQSNWLQSGDHGLKIIASKNIYVRVVFQPDAHRQGFDPLYGKTHGDGSATHGAAYTSKGIAKGAGVDFYTAHFYSQNKISTPRDQDFISVMSLEDGNTITLDSPEDWETPNGIDLNNTTVTVNEGESILFKRSWSANNHSLGTRVYSTNDKKMLVYSGSWGGELRIVIAKISI